MADETTPDLRSTIDSAFKAAEARQETPEPTAAPAAEAAPEPAQEATEAPVEAAPVTTGAPRDDKGKFLPKTEKPGNKPLAPPAVKPDAGKVELPKPQPEAAAKPPAGWKPAEREAWGKIPAEAQAAISRREKEIAQAMQQAAPERQVAQRYQSIVSPYLGMIKAEGGDPLATTESLFQTYAALRTAPPATKAGLLANIIQTFGVDPAMIAAHLQGQAPADQQQGFDPNQLRQSIKQELLADLQSQRMASLSQGYEQKVAEFSAEHEFLDDLREPMAKLIEAGLADDFEDAYNKAASMNPDVSRTLRQREEAKQANAQLASTQRARAASSGLKSSPAGIAVTPQPTGLRDMIGEIWDRHSGASR